MKKELFYSLLFTAGLCMATACSDDDGGNGDGDGGGSGSNLPVASVEQAQQEIDRVSKEFLNSINVEEIKPVVNLAAYCDQTFFSDYDINTPEGDYEEMRPDYGLYQLMTTFRQAASGDFTTVVSHKRIGEIHSITQYYGDWVWDETDKQWDEIDHGAGEPSPTALTYTFKHEGQTCVASVKGSGETYTLQKKDSTGYVFETLEIPATVTATVTEGGKQLVTLVVNTTKCDLDGKILEMNAELKMGNLKTIGVLNDNNTEATAEAKLFADNKELILMACKVNGNNLADADMMAGGYFDAATELKAGNIACNIMQSMSLGFTADNNDGNLAQSTDFDGYYSHSESFNEWTDTVYVWDYSSHEAAKAMAVKAAETANNKVQAALYFANSTYSTPVTFAPVHYEYHRYEWQNPDNPAYYDKSYSGEWDIEPLLNFENGTTYTFGQYFNSTRFQSVIDVYNELVEKVTGNL